jgi:hypothetical protein
MLRTTLCAFLLVATVGGRALAQDADVDTRSFEFLDVIETNDGSIWKGVIVEQTPNVQYKLVGSDGSVHVIKAETVTKISKQKNRDWRATTATPASTTAPAGQAPMPAGNGVGASYETHGGGLQAPLATDGLRLDPSFALVFASGDFGTHGPDMSYSPDVRVGYEKMLGNVGLGGGVMGRFTYWQLPSGTPSGMALWTLETHAYGRVALHISRVAVFGGASLGLDTNYINLGGQLMNMTKTATGLGVNVQSGIELLATDQVAAQLMFDYHPGTDSSPIPKGNSAEFFALALGVSVRL